MPAFKKSFFYLLIFNAFILINSCSEKQINNIKNELTSTNIKVDTSKNITDTVNHISKQDSLLKIDSTENQEFVEDSTKNYVYLTFDDGPFKGSININKIISEENIKATVFIVGMNAFTPDLKQHIVDYQNNNLIELANHTYSHAHRNKFKKYYNHPEWVLEDVQKNDSLYKFSNRFVRLPGRNTWRLGNSTKNDFDKASKNSSNFLAENQYYILGWDYEWDKQSKKHPLLTNPEVIYNGIVNRLDRKLTFKDRHLVLLMHDDMFNDEADAEKLRTLIKLIKNNENIILEFASNYPISLS